MRTLTSSLILVACLLAGAFRPAPVFAAAPTVDSVRFAVAQNGANVSPITLAANAMKIYYINGDVSDTDGFADISDVDADFYRSSISGAGDCSADQNNCYHQTTCTLSSGSGNTVSYSCRIDLAYFADYTDADTYASDTWKIRVSVTDSNTTITDTTYSNELTSLAAIDVPGSLNYGTLSLGATSSTTGMTVKNAGNHLVDAQVWSTTGMTCTSGTIPLSNQHWDKVSVAYGSLQFTLSTTPTRSTINLSIQSDDATAVTGDLFFAIQLPANGIGGTCTGTLNITAYAF